MSKEIVLIQPPILEFPICTPPLGISYLKSFVERNSQYSVFCFDMALDFLTHLFDISLLRHIYEKNQHLFPVEIFKTGFIGSVSIDRIDESVNAIRDQKHFEHIGTYNSCIGYLLYANECFVKPVYEIIKNALEQNLNLHREAKKILGVERLAQFSPKIVGFSIMYEKQLVCSLAISKILKDLVPSMPIVFGGALFGFMDQVEIRKLLSITSVPDYLILGDGEQPFLELLESLLSQKKRPKGIPGVWFHEGNNVQCINAKFVSNLDELPVPDFSDFEMEKYHVPEPLLPILGSRGCYWGKCTFCAYDRNYIARGTDRSVRSIVQEIKAHQIRYKCSKFTFADSGISFKKLKEIACEIKGEGLKVHFECMSRPEHGFTYERDLAYLKSSGLTRIEFGAESLTQRLLHLMKKGTRDSDIVSIMKCMKRLGIDALYFYIIGFPSHKISELFDEIRLILNNLQNVGGMAFSPFTLLRHAPIMGVEELQSIIEIHDRYGVPMIKLNGTTIFHEDICFETKSGIKREDATIWAEIMDEVTSSLIAINDPYHKYQSEHRFIRLVIDDISQQKAENTGLSGKSNNTQYFSEKYLSGVKSKVITYIDYLQRYEKDDEILISFLITILRSRINAIEDWLAKNTHHTEDRSIMSETA